MKNILLFLFLYGTLTAQSYYSNGVLKTLKPVTVSKVGIMSTAVDKNSDIQWYTSEQGEVVGVLNTIVVKWKTGVNPLNILQELDLTGTRITETMWKISVPTNRDVFKLAQELYLHEATVFASPDMIRERKSR